MNKYLENKKGKFDNKYKIYKYRFYLFIFAAIIAAIIICLAFFYILMPFLAGLHSWNEIVLLTLGLIIFLLAILLPRSVVAFIAAPFILTVIVLAIYSSLSSSDVKKDIHNSDSNKTYIKNQVLQKQ